MTMKELETIEEELKAVVEAHNKEIEELEAEINKAKEEKAKAEKNTIETKKGNDPEKYAKAVADLRTANDIVEFYNGKLETLKNEPIISKEEYNKYSDTIKQELDKANSKKEAKAIDLLDELDDIKEDMFQVINKGNSILEKLQHELYKDDASIARNDGSKVRMEHLENRYKNYNLPQGISSIMNSPYANSITKNRGRQ